MKNLNAHFPNTRLGESEIKIICICLLLFVISSCITPEEELTNIPDYRTDQSKALLISETTISSNTELSDRVNGVDYIIPHPFEVTAKLTIKPGVTIMFDEGAGIVVKETGALMAMGEDGNEIYFLSKSGKRGSWKGITILSNSTQNIMTYCRIEHGGGENIYGRADLIIGDHAHVASAQVHHNDIRTSESTGILIAEGSTATWFAYNNINTNTGYPVSTHITNAAMLQDGNTFSNNGKEFIELTGSGNNMIQTPVRIPRLKQAYALTGAIRLGANLSIAAGTRLNMTENAQLMIDGETGDGSLTAIGNSTSPIIIQGMYSTSGLWSSITFASSSSTLNQLEHCQISGGGGTHSSAYRGMINFIGSGSNQVIIRNSTIANSATNGIYIKQGSTIYNADIETANSFVNNAGANVFYDPNTLPPITH